MTYLFYISKIFATLLYTRQVSATYLSWTDIQVELRNIEYIEIQVFSNILVLYRAHVSKMLIW